MVIPPSGRVGLWRWCDEDRGAIDVLGSVGVARATVVTLIYDQGTGSDQRSPRTMCRDHEQSGSREYQRVDA
jgi:hypothetical protein